MMKRIRILLLFLLINDVIVVPYNTNYSVFKIVESFDSLMSILSSYDATIIVGSISFEVDYEAI